jgi:Gpi18-like mannosyltransferase
MGVFVWWSDELVYRFTKRWYGDRVAYTAWALYLANWFVFYGMIRTYSNSLEAIFFFAAYEAWAEERYSVANIYIGLSCFCRPTAIILAIPLYLQRPRSILSAIPIGLICIAIQIGVDSWFYGAQTLTLYNFFQFNVY